MKTKKIIIISFIGVLALSLAGAILVFDGGDGHGGDCHGDTTCMAERQNANSQRAVNSDKSNQEKSSGCKELDDIKRSPVQGMSDSDKNGISHKREEEKIARDVYIKLYEK